MRPSHYHYLKRMWTRYFYNRSRYKKQHKSILLAPLRFLIWFCTLPFKIVFFYPFMIIKKLFTHNYKTTKGCSTLFVKSFKYLMIICFIVYILDNFFYLFGYGPFILLFIFLIMGLLGYRITKKKTAVFDEFNLKDTADVIPNDRNVESSSTDSPINSNVAITSTSIDSIDFTTRKKRNESHMSSYDIERYAIMCNAYIEHKEEMEQYEFLDTASTHANENRE